MKICDRCIHADVCGEEGAFEEALTYCGDYIGWIPIDEDHMPEEGKEVLFTVAKGAWNYEPAVLSGWFVSKYQEFEIDDEGRSVELEDVVAWMPLPKPYKESEVEENGTPLQKGHWIIKEDRYEARLKADMVAMLEEFDLRLSEYEDADLLRVDYIRQDIQEKINTLNAESEG